MPVEIGYVIEVEKDGLRKLFGPVIGFSRADLKAMMLRKLDSQAIIRVHRLNAFNDDFDDFDDMSPINPAIHPNQTTISDHITDIHDHVG